MRTQLVVAQAVRRIWPHAESAGAGRPGPDLLGTPGVDVEVAARRGLPIVEKMKQLRGRATDGVVGAVVLRPDGMGEASVDDWPVFMRLADWLDVMSAAGYGDPRDPAALADAMDRHPSARGLRAVDPVPRVVGPVTSGQPEDPGVHCACGAPWIGSVSHSRAVCSGPEAS